MNPQQPITGLSPQQLDGMACARCGAAAVQVDEAAGKIIAPAMKPLAEAPQLFVCDPACKVSVEGGSHVSPC